MPKSKLLKSSLIITLIELSLVALLMAYLWFDASYGSHEYASDTAGHGMAIAILTIPFAYFFTLSVINALAFMLTNKWLAGLQVILSLAPLATPFSHTIIFALPQIILLVVFILKKSTSIN
ncbi:hypothetical protein [Streptococcus merionis]|uniref:Uncharacterized protein n=1 Tax=Streptococcus merionis TaxID=400065 RepID=A0A239SVE8_9STRE|nr:hypothetical protein [Streptococcus merionis]SNU88798.1 Uncharacterised protein [Streptococcus merionis]